MEETSLIEDAGSQVQEQQQQVQQAEVSKAVDDVALERPEWLQDKYLANDRGMEDAIKEQAKAYTELQKRFGGFTGAPEQYESVLPDGISGEIDMENPLLSEFNEFAKNSNMSQEMYSQILGFSAKHLEGALSQLFPDPAYEKQQLGAQADQRLAALSGWGANNLSPEEFGAFKELATTANGVAVLEKMISMTRNSKMSETPSNPVANFTEEDFKRAVQSDRYYSDADYRAEVQRKAQAMLG